MDKIFVKRSPLFYVGDKHKLIPKITQHFPINIKRFVEPFTGGGSVFLNVHAESYLLNDIDSNVIEIHKFLMEQANKPNDFINNVISIIDKYNLSKSFQRDIVPNELKEKWKKTYYARFNKNGYERLREAFNTEWNKDPLILYILLIYGFNRMLRFNSNGKFNIPVGNVDFNQNVYRALITYFKFVSNKKIQLYNLDFCEFLSLIKLSKNDFVYFDPPYLITYSEYNKLWNETKEKQLLRTLNNLNNQGVRFALSNVVRYNGSQNKFLQKWMSSYNVIQIRSNYINYHNNTQKQINEVLITNYGKI